ncbi:MAG: TrmH family RNA methyltransferase, partial [Chloroflexi bacterium]|nr:TrmH family RNA methyltransferase [Chloroflexota bacterium]
MSAELLAGEQLEGQVLYERQKEMRGAGAYLPGPPIVAVGLQVPENIGSVLRLADAAGSQRVIFLNHAASDLARVRRAARNCDALVKWEFLSQEEFLAEIAPSLPQLIALELTTRSLSIFKANLPEQCAFVIGSERYGIPPSVLAECQQAVHIPMYGVNGSMNVTHALAVALFEWRRQH